MVKLMDLIVEKINYNKELSRDERLLFIPKISKRCRWKQSMEILKLKI